MFSRVLIANRGTVARRVVRACDALGIESVALYSDADAAAPYLAEATSARGLAGVTARETYLDVDAVLKALADSGADAVHPGYGFLAENGDFARAVAAAGATFIGPDPRWLDAMGDKVAARRLMRDAGFPVGRGSEALVDLDDAIARAEALGYPLMLKPSGGGGGIGMRVVRDEAELRSAYPQAEAIAEGSFGDAGLYLEAFHENARHVEIQVLADGRGNAVHAYERECSLQRRQQKVIEETPAPGIDGAALARLSEDAARAVGALG
mgnify:CR=1 FL=1